MEEHLSFTPKSSSRNGLKCLETCWNHHVFCFLAVLAIDCRWLEARASWRCWHMLARDFCSTSCHFLTWASSYPTFHSGFFHSHGGMVRKGCNLAETQRAPWWWHCSFCSTTIEHHNGPHRFMMRAHLRIISTFMYATLYARMYTPIPLYIFCDVCCQWWYLGLFETRGARCTPSKLKIII